jgi:glycosyltransferase involved in cell wall biosynthesis
VIATDVGGTREISDESDLVLVRAKEVDELFNAIKVCLVKYREIQGISYEKVRDKFDWKKSVEKYVQLYISFNIFS